MLSITSDTLPTLPFCRTTVYLQPALYHLHLNMSPDRYEAELKANAARLARRGRGILAADESVGTIGKRLIALGLENVEENRRTFREILICAPGICEAFSGVILFHETVYQSGDGGKRFVQILAEKGILPGVKVDTGLKPVEDSPGETYTSGLDGLAERCREYYKEGARFAKWRSALRIDVEKGLPTNDVVAENAATLAKYAKIAQGEGLMPIVEPEILIDGVHSQQVSADETRRVLTKCYEALRKEGVMLEGTLLKPMMIMPGVASPDREAITPQQVAEVTLQVMTEVVPGEVPGIMFLSGGMSESQATENLNALNKLADSKGGASWSLSFSYGRALQTSPMNLWAGKSENIDGAKKVAAALALANASAQLGKFTGDHPSTTTAKSLYEGFRGWRSGEDPKGV